MHLITQPLMVWVDVGTVEAECTKTTITTAIKLARKWAAPTSAMLVISDALNRQEADTTQWADTTD